MNTDKILVKLPYILTGVFIAIIPKFLFPSIIPHIRSERQSKSVEIRENVADKTVERLKRIIKTDANS